MQKLTRAQSSVEQDVYAHQDYLNGVAVPLDLMTSQAVCLKP